MTAEVIDFGSVREAYERAKACEAEARNCDAKTKAILNRFAQHLRSQARGNGTARTTGGAGRQSRAAPA